MYHRQYPQYNAQHPQPQGPTGKDVNPVANNPQSNGNSQTIGGDNNQEAPMLASFGGYQGLNEVKYKTAPSANQNVQWGSVDYGYGWTDCDGHMAYNGLSAASNGYF